MLQLARRLRLDRRGNVALMFALSAPVLLYAVGVAVDLSRAQMVHTRMNAAADSAALAALTPAMLQSSASVAQAASVAMFNAKVSGISSLIPANTVVTATITNPGGNVLKRQVVVTYTAQTSTIFSGVLKSASIGVGGNSTAVASIPPNIDFYLLLDNSPSMSLPTSSAGITSMQNLTPLEGGCAFACHQAGTNNSDTAGNPCSDGSSPTVNNGHFCAAKNKAGKAIYQIDNFALARLNNIPLRLDELSSGVSELMTTANSYTNSTQFSTPPSYRFAAYQMDLPWTVGTTDYRIMSLTSNYVSSWQSSSSNFGVMEMFQNSTGCTDSTCTTGTAFNDVATNYDVALSSINSIMPAPGNGTNLPGDQPQEVLFFVTDGVEDEQSGGSRLIQAINTNGATNYCNAIKARGIQIAILYTEYLPVPNNSFYVSYVQPFQPNIGPQLQACASPGLFYDAVIGTDLGKALSTLFQAAAHSAALSN